MTTETDERGGLPSASSFGRLCQCPGSQNLINSIPRELLERQRSKEDDEMAARGTRIHKARELLSDAGLENDEEIAAYEAGKECERLLLERWISDHNLNLNDIREGPREERLWLHDDNLQPLISGKPDFHYLAPPLGFVMDKKSGYCTNLPLSNASAQLRIQALLIWQNRSDIHEMRVAYEKDLAKPSVAASDYCDYKEEDLQHALMDTKYRIWLSRQPDAQRTPGPECRWCPAKAWCREGGAWSLLPSVQKEEQYTVIAPDPVQHVQTLSLMDCVKIWAMGPLVEKIIKEVVRRLKGLPKEQLANLGLELGKGRANDSFMSYELFQYLRDEKGWTEEEILGCCDFGKGKLVERFMARETLAKKYAAMRVDEELNPYIIRDRCEPSLRSIKGIET